MARSRQRARPGPYSDTGSPTARGESPGRGNLPRNPRREAPGPGAPTKPSTGPAAAVGGPVGPRPSRLVEPVERVQRPDREFRIGGIDQDRELDLRGRD